MPLLKAERVATNYEMKITDATGNSMKIDIPVEQGGNGNGMRPMQTVLAALCGCSSVDVVSILNKQKQQLTHFSIVVDGEREKDKEPSVWQNVQVQFYLEGNIEPNKAIRAVELSMEKYCSVAETLRRAGATITYQIFLNSVEVLKK